jgi:hypothetical protein
MLAGNDRKGATLAWQHAATNQMPSVLHVAMFPRLQLTHFVDVQAELSSRKFELHPRSQGMRGFQAFLTRNTRRNSAESRDSSQTPN